MYDFAGAAADFDHLAGISDAAPGAKLDEVRSWQDRSRRARDLRDATHYAVLGLQQRADDAEIRRAYRKASMRWHPDRQKAEAPAVGEEEQSSSVFAEERARAEGHFRRINEAKETLLDSYKRAVYDVEARRRIAAEAEDAQWPWLSPKQPMAQPAAQTGIVVHNGLRVTRAWVPPARKQAPAASPAASPMKAEAKAEAKVDAEVPPAAPPARPMPATPVAADVDADADVRVSSSADSAVGEGDDDDAAQPEEREWSWRLQKYEDELRRQRDELEKARAARAVASDERQRQEALAERLETEVAAAKLRAERRAADLGTATPRESSPRARRFADADSADADSPARWPRNAGDSPPRSWRKDDGAASDDSEDYDVRSAASAASGASDASSSRTPSVGDAASPAGAAPADAPVGGRSSAFFAPKAGRSPVDFEDDFCDDNTTPRADSPAAFGDGEAKGFSDDLMAQLRDAAEWFDHLDSERRGELDMAHFDELTTHLGLGDVLGDDEMRRQRYFADPVGSGRLRRGTFLGWFAALLEGKGNLKGAL